MITVLEITVGHWPFSDQFQYLTDQNSFCSDKFTVHFQWKAIKIPVKSSNLLKMSDQFLNLISGTVIMIEIQYSGTALSLLVNPRILHQDNCTAHPTSIFIV